MLITQLKEFEKWFPNSTYNKFEKLATFFEKAEYKHLRPVLGTKLHTEVEKLYNSNSDKANDQKLIELCQSLIVHFAIHDALPILNVTLNQFGSLSVTQNDNTTAASKERTERLEASLHEMAWDDVEQLLLFLEENSSEYTDETGKELWKQSEWYNSQTGCLIFTAQEFNEVVNINNSRVKFKQLYPAIKKVERIKLRPAFGKKTIQSLIQRKMDNELTDNDKELLEHMQSALALLVIPEDEELSRPDSIHGYKPFEARQQAEQEIVECKKILRDNPEEYPDYIENKSGYEPVKPFENSNDNPIFLIGGTTR